MRNLERKSDYERKVGIADRIGSAGIIPEGRSKIFEGFGENSELGKTNVLMCPTYEFMGQNQIILEGVKNLFAEPPKARFCLHFTRALK
jgi:hypothetical protein